MPAFYAKIVRLDKRDYINFNEESFLDDLTIQNWRVTSNDPNFNDFLWRLEGSIERHVNKKETRFLSKPSITNEIKHKINDRDKIFYRKKNAPHDKYLKIVYNKFRNSVNRDIKNAKKD